MKYDLNENTDGQITYLINFVETTAVFDLHSKLFSYQVLMYNGQLDVIVAAPLTQRFLPTVNWTGAAEYRTAPRFHWRLQPGDREVAGYVRQVGEFYQVSIRGRD